jgi:hypothetical protein
MPDFVIDDSTSPDVLFDPRQARGLVPRDYTAYPPEMFAPPSELPLIPRSEWDARIEEQERLGSSLEHLRATMAGGQWFASLDQNPQGYCWAYSTTATVMFARAVSNQPFVELQAHGIACKLMDFADRGGWCGLSAKFAREVGIPSKSVWPDANRMSRTNDRPEAWANAAQYRITEDWVDLTRPVWGQNLTFDQVATCLLTNVPVALDFNWWGHSVCGIRLVRVEAGSYGIKILNSWSDAWGDRGMGVLRGPRAIPDGAIATRVVRASGGGD